MDMTCRRILFLLPILSAGFCPAGCREPTQFVPPPPPKVTVARPLQQEVVTFIELPGRTEAVESVEVRARVPGFLKSIEFEEGKEVEAGTLLYTIEPEPYEAALQAARARQAEAEAELHRAEDEFGRVSRLYEQQNAAEKEFVEAKADFERAKAAVLAAEADVMQAELDLSYTEVFAPIAGRVNRTAVDVGNLVGQSEPTVLTTIVPWDPIHVYVSVSERDVLGWRRREAAGEGRSDVSVFLRLADGTNYPLAGRIDYIDNRVDPETGTLRVRAAFENPEGLLVPGIYVRVRVPREPSRAVLVPEVALQRDIVGPYLLTVDEQGEVERATIVTGPMAGAYRVVASGLTGDERVIIKGLQRARPGVKVDAEWTELPPVEQLPGMPTPASVASQPAGQEN
jgi:RND family efflux transporter MFP subunit